MRINPDYAKNDVWTKKEKKLEVICDQCMSVNEVVPEKDEEEVVIECEWCSHKCLVNFKK